MTTTTTRRVAALALAVALTAGPAGPASADHPAPYCPTAGSTTLASSDLPYLRLRHHQASPTASYVCFSTYGTTGILVVRGDQPGTPPRVAVGRGDGTCPTPVVDVGDPAVSVSVSTAPPALCVALYGKTTTVTYTSSGTGVEYWRDGGLLDETVFCLPELVEYLRMPEVNWEPYAECAYHPHRVL